MDDTRFVSEIRMQPAALRTVTDFYSGENGAALLSRIAEIVRAKRKLVFTGMGTSLYAPYILVKELAEILPCLEIIDAGELLHFGLKSFHGDEIVIAVSQSGESIETKQVVNALKGKVAVASIVNNLSSSLAMNSDHVLPLHAGNEASISTKTYTNTLAVLLLLSTHIRSEKPGDIVHHLRETAGIMEKNLEEINSRAHRAAEFFGDLSILHLIARGSDLVTARQWALTMKEGTGVFTEALSAGLFRHGPIELAGCGHHAVCILSRDNKPELTANLAEDLAKFGTRVLVIADARYTDLENLPVLVIPVECPVSRFFPLLCAPFIEFFIHETAKNKGREAGIFRHAHKTTSRE
jgi:glucosamine--fructose-6-phosphate aminotransferase (isomerizing)